MAIDRIGAAYIDAYMKAESAVNIVDVVYPYSDYNIRKAQDIIDECAHQAETLNPSSEEDRNKERRLRQLTAIILNMQEVGLIE